MNRKFATAMTAGAIGAGALLALVPHASADTTGGGHADTVTAAGNTAYFWENDNFRQNRHDARVGENFKDLHSTGHEDDISSLKNPTSRVVYIFEDDNFKGQKACVRANSQVPNLAAPMEDAISSISWGGSGRCAEGVPPIGNPIP